MDVMYSDITYLCLGLKKLERLVWKFHYLLIKLKIHIIDHMGTFLRNSIHLYLTLVLTKRLRKLSFWDFRSLKWIYRTHQDINMRFVCIDFSHHDSWPQGSFSIRKYFLKIWPITIFPGKIWVYNLKWKPNISLELQDTEPINLEI